MSRSFNNGTPPAMRVDASKPTPRRSTDRFFISEGLSDLQDTLDERAKEDALTDSFLDDYTHFGSPFDNDLFDLDAMDEGAHVGEGDFPFYDPYVFDMDW